jgi:acyl-coenzyme A thioesterase PaaI-like protein
MIVSITPAEQRILDEAGDYLRTRQPRSGVTVVGLVVRLFRTSAFGRGEVVVQGVDDDFGVARRYRIDLGEDHYNEAVRAHGEGLQVIATGDVDIRGTRRSLMRLTSFAVLPGLGQDY